MMPAGCIISFNLSLRNNDEEFSTNRIQACCQTTLIVIFYKILPRYPVEIIKSNELPIINFAIPFRFGGRNKMMPYILGQKNALLQTG